MPTISEKVCDVAFWPIAEGRLDAANVRFQEWSGRRRSHRRQDRFLPRSDLKVSADWGTQSVGSIDLQCGASYDKWAERNFCISWTELLAASASYLSQCPYDLMPSTRAGAGTSKA
jgi:hypothetical protein